MTWLKLRRLKREHKNDWRRPGVYVHTGQVEDASELRLPPQWTEK